MEEKNMIHILKRLKYHNDVSIVWGWPNDRVEENINFTYLYFLWDANKTLTIFTEKTPNDSWKKSIEFWLKS